MIDNILFLDIINFPHLMIYHLNYYQNYTYYFVLYKLYYLYIKKIGILNLQGCKLFYFTF